MKKPEKKEVRQKRVVKKKQAPHKSTKGKLIIGAVIVLLAVLVYTQWGGKGTQSDQQVQQVMTTETGAGEMQLQDPCSDEEGMQAKMQALAKALSAAETELQGMEINLEFAKEDGTFVAEVEAAIENQRKYMAELNAALSERQESIKEC